MNGARIRRNRPWSSHLERELSVIGEDLELDDSGHWEADSERMAMMDVLRVLNVEGRRWGARVQRVGF